MPVYLHNGAMGDIIYALPVLRAQPGILALTKKRQKNFLDSLLILQPYIQEVTLEKPWKDSSGGANQVNKQTSPIQDYYIDLRKYREITETDYTKHLTLCHAEVAGIEIDSRTAWLEGIEPNPVAKIVVHRSPRYHGELDWEALRPFLADTVFVGKPEEYSEFPLPVAHHRTRNSLELAQVIAGSRFFVGNQSCPFAIAEALKHPRFLEVSTEKPNCTPQGCAGWTELTKERMELCLK